MEFVPPPQQCSIRGEHMLDPLLVHNHPSGHHMLDIRDYLKQLAGDGPLYFKPNPGNAGDSMIAHATFGLFDELGIRYHLIPPTAFDSSDKIVVYGGGGNLVDGRMEAREFIEAHHARAKRLVILPHTISGHEDLLQALGPNVDLIVRETISLAHAQTHACAANVMIADDMAFCLKLENLSRAHRSIFHTSLKQSLRRIGFLLSEHLHRVVTGTRSIDCFRTDKEQTEIERTFWNADIAKILQSGTKTPAQAATASSMIFDLLRQYDEVRTNRLHLAIAGALLGIQVKFYPNSYFKCEAVYRYSMQDRYPNIQWMGPTSETPN